MTRDHYVAGSAPDWAHVSQRFSPLVHSSVRPRPMATRRTVGVKQVESLKARWFALGSLATFAPIATAWGLIHLIGA